MASSDDREGETSYASLLQDGEGDDLSLVSAADWQMKSRLRTPRRTATNTPTRRLFPDNIDDIAPGMTPTSRYSGRATRNSAAGATPVRKTPRRPRGSSTLLSQAISTSPLAPAIRDNEQSETPPTEHVSRTPMTPRVEGGNRSILTARQSTAGVKRTPAAISRSSAGSSSKRQKTNLASWGRTREESPMELLRKLINAPGRLWSPTDEDERSQSISQQLERGGRQSSQGANSTLPAGDTPGANTADDLEGVERSVGRFSIANTSLAASDAGLARRAARQSQADNIFSDLMARDTSATSTNIADEILSGSGQSFNIRAEGEPGSLTGMAENSVLGGRLANESTRFDVDTSVALSTRRFEDIDMSQTFEEEGDVSEGKSDREFVETSNEASRAETLSEEDDEEEDKSEESRRSNSESRRSIERESEGGYNEEQELQIDDRGIFDESTGRRDFPPDDEGRQSIEEEEYEAYKGRKTNSSAILDEEESESEEEESPHENKHLRAARMVLLRRRRAKKKAKRYSSLTGNLVPSLPSNLIRQLFKSFATPNAGLATASQAGSKGKVKVENIALEAVEDLSHHFFAQMTQSLVSQADKLEKKSITEKDIINLMKSQGQISARNSLPFLARRSLPKELSDLITSTTVDDATGSRKRPHKERPTASREDNRAAQAEDQEESV